MNCWEFKKCGREAGGERSEELGVCTAYIRDAGGACWLVAGTFCRGEVQGLFAEKLASCELCDFYQSFDTAHRQNVSEKLRAN
jgi:hypothetical protein